MKIHYVILLALLISASVLRGQGFSGGSGGGNGGATIPSVTNLIKGDGAGNGADSGIATSVVAIKHFGTAAPGSVAGNLPGDLFSDTTNHNLYICNAASGTAAPACTAVTAGGWTLLNVLSPTVAAFVDPTSSVQTQLNGKVATSTTVAGHALSSNVSVACADLSNGGSGCTAALVTSVGSPGADTNVPSEKAVSTGLAGKAASNASTTVNGQTCTLGSSCTISTGVPYSLTDPTGISFSWRNQGSATATARTRSIFLNAPAVSGNQIRGQEISAPSVPYSITVGLIPQLNAQNFNEAGIYVTDGTKLATIGLYSNSGLAFCYEHYTNVSAISSGSVGCSGLLYSPGVIFLKLLVDSSNITAYWSVNGTDFTKIAQETVTTFLSTTPTAIGFYTESNNSSWPAGAWVVSWVQGTS